MARKTTIDRLTADVQKILDQYGDNVKGNLDDIIKDLSKKGAKAVRAQAKSTFNGTGRYAKGWTSKFEAGRLSSQGVIFNKDVPGLPHLLEHGHANRNGGRTPGRVHIANVEEQLVKEFEQKVKAKL